MAAILSVTNISKSFGEFVALDNVSLAIESGSILGLLGPNGAGKTTLIRILTGITGPDSGSVNLFEHNHKVTRISYLPEERGLYKSMKVWEQALYLTQLKGLSRIEATTNLKLWFDKFQMSEWLNKPVDSLSKGMQQRLQFVITVASKPDLLILDEPFSGFDPVNADIIKNEIIALSESGITIVLSTHNMSSVEQLCTHICLVNRGKIMINNHLSEVRSQYGKNQFEITFKGSTVGFANALGHRFELVSIATKNEIHTAQIKSHGPHSANDLLGALLPYVELKSLNEHNPSMNDIFLEVVNEVQLESTPHE